MGDGYRTLRSMSREEYRAFRKRKRCARCYDNRGRAGHRLARRLPDDVMECPDCGGVCFFRGERLPRTLWAPLPDDENFTAYDVDIPRRVYVVTYGKHRGQR